MTNTKKHVYNFSAGPSKLPDEVLQEISEELTDYKGNGYSIIEISHRSPMFEEVLAQAEHDVRTLMDIPDDYAVLFTHGGASLNFSMAPLNFSVNGKAAYVDTGVWSDKAFAEAGKFTKPVVVASSKETGYDHIPQLDTQAIDREGYDFLHITTNNTIFGTQFRDIPNLQTPLIADASSDIMGRWLDVSRFGMIYAGLQKNLGPAGMGLVIVRKDLMQRAPDSIPKLLNYNTYQEYDSMFNTPNTFAIYAMGKVMKWLIKQGGVRKVEETNRFKSALIYEVLDDSDFYSTKVKTDSRSIMNVVFHLPSQELTTQFLTEATNHNLLFLRGHKIAGGIRASLYNALGIDAAKHLADFMRNFENKAKSS